MTEIAHRELLDRIADGIVAWDADWRYTFVNASAGALLGHRPEELVGRTYHELFPEAAGTPFALAYERAMRDQVSFVMEDYYAPWDRWFENRIYPNDGGLVILFLETTERKRAEAEIVRARNRLDLLHALDRAILAEEAFESVAATAVAGLGGLPSVDGVSVVGPGPGSGATPPAVTGGTLSEGASRAGTAALVATGESVLLDLAGDDPGGALADALRAHGAVAFRRLALRSVSGTPVGSLNLVTANANGFSPDAMLAAEGVAAQLEIAVRQTELLDGLRVRATRLEGLHAMDRAILAAASVGDVAAVAARHLRSMLAVDRVTVARVDQVVVGIHVVGVAGVDPPPDLPVTIPVPPGVDLAAIVDPQVQLHPDLVAASATDAGAARLAAQGFVSSAHVPMVLEERVVGHIGVHSRTSRAFSADEVEMMVEIGHQLAIAFRDVGQREELERRATRLAGLHEVDRAIVAARSPAEVAAAAFAHLGRLLPGTASEFVTFDFAAAQATILRDGNALPGQPAVVVPLAELPYAVRVARGPGPIIADPAADMSDREREGIGRAESAILAPIATGDGDPLGIVIATRADPPAFDEASLVVVGEVCRQLAIALRQATYREELAAHATRLEGLLAMDAAILGTDDPSQVARTALEHLGRLVPRQRAAVILFEAADSARVLAVRDTADATVRAAPFMRPREAFEPLPTRLAQAAGPVTIDLDTDTLGEVFRDIRELGVRRILATPLRAGGELYGSLNIGSSDPGALDDRVREIVGEVAGRLAIALRQACLHDALTEREAHLRVILDGSPNPILTIDGAGRITFANPAASRSFRADGDLVGRSIDDLVPDAARERHGAGVASSFESAGFDGSAHGQGVEARRLDGSTFPVAIELAPIKRPSGTEVVVTLVDLSDRVALERRMAQAQRIEMLGEFGGILAHDVRNYINAIGWSAGALAEQLPREDPRRADVDLIEGAVAEARDMVASVLEFARPADRTGRTDIAGHLARVGGIVARLLGPSIDLVTDIPGGLPLVTIAPASLTQVLVNLTTNARDAMPGGGTLRITARPQHRRGAAPEQGLPPGRYVRIEVTDTGEGMDDLTASRAFEAFYSSKADTEQGDSVGLGLASVFLVVARAGGSVELRSARGAGTTFVIDLPVADSEPEAPAGT